MDDLEVLEDVMPALMDLADAVDARDREAVAQILAGSRPDALAVVAAEAIGALRNTIDELREQARVDRRDARQIVCESMAEVSRLRLENADLRHRVAENRRIINARAASVPLARPRKAPHD